MERFKKKILTLFKKLGPGFITGAADDDPSGIATYSIAGAQFGYQLNWLSLFLIPAMIAIQEMCGRLGMVSGLGLAGLLRKYYPKWLLYGAISLLAFANIINIGADIQIIGAVLTMLTDIPTSVWIIVTTLCIIFLEIFIPYKKYAVILTFLGLTLTAYIATALLVKQDWPSIANQTLIPHIDWNLTYIMTMVGFLGTTISPYLFFWQASEEVEEEIAKGEIKDFGEKPKIPKKEIRAMRLDTTLGMIFSNTVTFFIILTTAATLHNNGITNIDTPQKAALALQPLAGNFAYILFAIGIIGIGLQSIPVLAGGIAYAFAETFHWKEGLSKKFLQARNFYIIIILSTCIGMILNIIGINAMQALYYAAIVNGVVAVPLIAIIIMMANNTVIVGNYKTKKTQNIIAWITFFFMFCASLLMIKSLLFK